MGLDPLPALRARPELRGDRLVQRDARLLLVRRLERFGRDVLPLLLGRRLVIGHLQRRVGGLDEPGAQLGVARDLLE
jgi:hypothetical protein